MPDTRQKLERALLEYQEEKKTNEDAIRETLKLLKRADQRLREKPGEKSKWGRTVDNLEDTLSEKKRLLTTSETNIVQITRKLEAGKFIEDDGGSGTANEPEPARPVVQSKPLSIPENLSLEDLKAAVRRILASHIIKIHDISDLDFKLAKALLDSRAAQSLSNSDTLELRKRLTILEKRGGRARQHGVIAHEPKEPESTPVDGQTQHVVQSALQKYANKQFDAITLEEIEMLAKYRKALSLQGDGPNKNLLPLCDDSLAAIHERIRGIAFD